MSEVEEQITDKKESTALEQFSANLKEVREKKGLTIQSVAADLRLNKDLIQALETNDTANLPSKIFVMGYLRSYARYLGVDESRLEQLDLSEINQTVDMNASFSGKPEKTSKAFSIRIVTYLVTIGMAALLAAWWLSKQPDLTEIAAVTTYQQDDENRANSFELPEKVSELVVTDSEEASASEPEMVVVESVINEEPVAIPVVIKEDAVETAPVTPSEPVAVANEAPAPEVMEEPIAQSELNITYLDDSWTEVSDANETRVLYGLYKKGREVSVQGIAPFTLFFGYAPGVVVTHNEEQIEHIKFHRDGVARFKVGTAEDNHLPNEN